MHQRRSPALTLLPIALYLIMGEPVGLLTLAGVIVPHIPVVTGLIASHQPEVVVITGASAPAGRATNAIDPLHWNV